MPKYNDFELDITLDNVDISYDRLHYTEGGAGSVNCSDYSVCRPCPYKI